MIRPFRTKVWFLAALFLVASPLTYGQAAKKDTTTAEKGKPGPTSKAANKPKSYGEVITKSAQTDRGLFIAHKVEERYFFEIPDSLFNRDFLVMTRVSRSGVDLRGSAMTGYAGDEVNSNVISFEKGPNDKVFLVKKSFSERSSDSAQAMFMSVDRSNMQPIAQSFDIKALATDSTGTVIDITDYISGDNDILHFNPRVKRSWQIAAIQADKSYIVAVQSFPLNTNIKAVKTFARAAAPAAGGAPASPSMGTVTLELTTSMVALPTIPMTPRYYDPRVGYFAISHMDFDENPQGVKRKVIAKRWRLEPKDADIERYKRGELVEPKKPIVIYIDPTTPEKWVPYLIQGVNDWQKAFEKAGFKNAIIGKRAPSYTEDPTWSMDDARNSVIVYKASSVANASGPSTADPRSGEIIETHINWYHNVMELLKNWYMVQASAIDPRARTMELDDNLMGELIRFVSSHEVGHTLGLRHNFISSATTPVEKLRDKAWLEKNGHTPSIMDYARFNYVAQPEDNISEKGIFPRIGDYDDWSVEWGYKWTGLPLKEETDMLAKLTTEKQSDKRLWFGTEMSANDPRLQSEDLGDNSMRASSYGIKNLKRVLAGLPEWTATPNEGFQNLNTMYSQVVGQFSRYVGHVTKNVAGIYETPKNIDQEGPVYEVVPREIQMEAMDWLNTNVFTAPTWLINPEISSRIGTDEIALMARTQDQVLAQLLSSRTFDKLVAAEAKHGDTTYTSLAFANALFDNVWTELRTGNEIDVYRRNLQKNFISRVNDILNPPAAAATATSTQVRMGGMSNAGFSDKSDGYSIVKAKVHDLRKDISRAIPRQKNTISKYHLQDMLERIDVMFSIK